MQEQKSPGLIGGRIGAAILAAVILAPTQAQAERRPETRSLPAGAAAARRAAPTPRAVAEPAGVAAGLERLRDAVGTRAAARDEGVARAEASERMRVGRTRDGYVRSLGAPAGRAWSVSAATGRDASAIAHGFMREQSALFGWAQRGTQLQARSARQSRGRTFVRFEQRRHGLKIFGAGVVAQVERSGGVSFVLADLARDTAALYAEDFSAQPDVGEASASAAALDLVAEVRSAVDAGADPAELMIFEPSVMGLTGRSRLVWNVRVRNAAGTVNEVVLVDARSGDVAFHYSEIMEAKDRKVYDSANSSTLPGTLELSDTPPDLDTSVADAQKAFDYFGDTYDFYYDNLGRDSYDDAGATLIARVRYCEPAGSCPYANAYWNGAEMRFGDGYASADDVVAHELTHAVTSSESNLIYWGESGAINEALSDIFGELVDLANGGAADTPANRWLLGEDLPIGAIRSMKDPTVYGDPDRRFSSLWYTGAEDNRGVHINSGVANKLAFLLGDGGTFNSQTVTGLGLAAVADLFYEAQVNLLVPASDYYDLDVALVQAAVNLSWSLAAHDSLNRAREAVEIAGGPDAVDVFADDFEAGVGNWEFREGFTCPLPGEDGYDPECVDKPPVGAWWGPSTERASSGSSSLYCAGAGPSAPTPGTSYVPGMWAWAIYGPFSLAEAEQAWAEFDLFLDIDYPYDDIFWGVSTDGEDFKGYVISPGPAGCTLGCSPPSWVHEVFNFAELGVDSPLGEAQVWFGFNFASDEVWEWEGAYVDAFSIQQRSGPATPTLVDRYRLFSDVTKEHHYTTDQNEYDTLATWGWVQEGVAHQVYQNDAAVFGQIPVPLYRLYHAGILQHLWTTDANEYAVLATYGWAQEGIDGYILAAEVPGVTTPLYRLAYAFEPLHLWTTDLNEYQVLPSLGWIQEGVVGHVVP